MGNRVVFLLIVFIFSSNSFAKKNYIQANIKALYDEVYSSHEDDLRAAQDYFLDEVHPRIMKGYEVYDSNVGQQINTHLLASYSYLKPRWQQIKQQTTSYYQSNHPISYYYFNDVPAFVKKTYEVAIINLWGYLDSMSSEELAIASPDQMHAVQLAAAAGRSMAEIRITPEGQHLNRLLEQLRPYVRDSGMESCYKVVYFEHEIMNAFSIGCNVFFSSTLYEEIKSDDDKLRAVLAHEVSHGDRGHGLKTLYAMIESGVKVSSQLLYEEGKWLVRGGESELLNKLAFENVDFLELVINNFAEKAPAIEIDADVHAVKILNNAGYSAQSLIDFLEFIHVVSENSACDQETLPGKSSVRKYPSLCRRVEAIESAMSY